MKNFREKTISGVAWSVVDKGGQQALNLVIMILLARLLSPEEFGLVAMVIVLTGFAGLFFELGLGASLIQKQSAREAHRSSVFWVNLGAGLVLMIGFVLAAPWVAAFYQEPILHRLTQVLAVVFMIDALAAVQQTLIRKALNFRMLAVVDVAAVGLAGVVAIAMALYGFGVWSLVWRYLIASVVTTALLWVLSDWRPAFMFDWRALKELLGFGASMMGTRVMNYWTRQSDNLLIGWRLGSDALGLYSRAYSLLLFPLINVTRVVADVMFPSFSIIQADKARIKRIYLRATRVIALVTFPMMIGLLVTARPFVLAVFGAQWAGMIPLVQVFALVGLEQSISKTPGTLYLSQGRADLQFKVGFFVRALLILGIVAGLWWGVLGVAIGYGLASLVSFYPNFYFAGRLVDLRFRELLLNLLPVTACAVGMGLLVALVGGQVPADWPAWAQLAVQTATGVIVYAALVHFLKVAAYKEARAIVEEKLLARRTRRQKPDPRKEPHPQEEVGS